MGNRPRCDRGEGLTTKQEGKLKKRLQDVLSRWNIDKYAGMQIDDVWVEIGKREIPKILDEAKADFPEGGSLVGLPTVLSECERKLVDSVIRQVTESFLAWREKWFGE